MTSRRDGAARLVRAAPGSRLLPGVLMCAALLAMAIPTDRLSSAAAAVRQPQGGAAEPTILVLPPRSRLAPSAPPDLPAGALTPMTATFTVRTTRGTHVDVSRQTVTFTPERVHLTLQGRQEWLFVRNAVDPRRVSGFVVHHSDKAIVVYEESDLRHWMGIRGWADVMMFGRRRDVTLRTSTAVVHFRLDRMQASVNPRLLSLPSGRFPTYRTADLAGWLER